jgi:hypothetical protein
MNLPAKGIGTTLAANLLKQSEQDAAITPMNAILDVARGRTLYRRPMQSAVMEGKYQIDAYALTPNDQKPIEEVFDFLLRP